jgi:D-alanine-D-alanine ligase-like ATP-grasp enzyme
VSLYADGGTTVVGSGVVTSAGTFDIVTSATFADATHSLAAIATDGAGLSSAPSAAFAVAVDPTAPSVTTLVGQPVNGGTLEVQGLGEAGTTVSLYADGGTTVVGSGVVTSAGTFDIVTTATFADATHSLAAIATDGAGLSSAPSASFAVAVDPSAPAVTALVGQPVNGGTITVTGTGEAGTTVSLYADGGTAVVGSGLVTSAGTFSITTSATFADATHTLAAIATDGAGLSSAPSAGFAVAVDPTAPAVTALVGQPVNGGTITVTGTGEAGTTVSLYADGGTAVVGSGLVTSAGTFSITTSATFTAGPHTLVAAAADGAGLQSAPSAAFPVTVQSTSVTTAWKSAVSADWSVASDWTSGVAPNDGSALATVAVAGTYKVTVGALETFSLGTLTINNASATLDLAGTLTLSGGLTVGAGKVLLDHGGTLNGAASLAANTTLTGYGRLGGAVADMGAIAISGGRLVIAGPLSGAGGTISIAAGASLELGAASAGPTITFASGAAALLKLDAPTSVFDTITGFAAGDTIDLAGLTVTSDSYSSGALSLYNGASLLGSLAITGTFSKQVFALASDGAGGTTIALATASTPVITAPAPLAAILNVSSTISGMSVADADAVAAGLILTVTLSDGRGLFSATNIAGGAIAGVGSTKLTITGTLAQVNGDLATVTYLNSGLGTDTITVAALDSAGAAAASKLTAVTVGALAWSTPVSADWSTNSDWNSGYAPNSATLAPTITTAGTYTVSIAAGESFAVQSLTINNASALLSLSGALTAATSLKAGALQMATGGTLSGSLNLASQTRLFGAGLINASVVSAGVIEASGGLLKLAGVESGGTFVIDNGATLELGAAATGAVSFAASPTGILKLDSFTQLSGGLNGFAAGAVIDLVQTTITSDQYASGVLTLYNGATKAGTLKIGGSFSRQIFALSSDGAGGTLISVVADVAPTFTAPSTLAAVVQTPVGISGLSLADANATVANETFTVTVSDVSGVLSGSAAAGGTFTGSGSARVTIGGTLAQVNGDLATLSYSNAKAGTDTINLAASSSTSTSSSPLAIKVTISSTPTKPKSLFDTAQFVQSMAAMGSSGGTGPWVTPDQHNPVSLALAAPQA